MTKETTLQTDLCVIGGGIAGVCTALTAARNGAQVVLVQDRSVLGGNASSEVRMHMVGASCSGQRPGARESGIIDELRVEDAVSNPHRSPHLFDLLLYDKVISEPNITLLLDTACVGCSTQSDSQGTAEMRITQVRALRNSTEEMFILEAPLFGQVGSEVVEKSDASRVHLERATVDGLPIAPGGDLDPRADREGEEHDPGSGREDPLRQRRPP